MRARPRSVLCFTTGLWLLSCAIGSCGGGGGGAAAMCGALASYVPSASGTVSFTTDVLPILTDKGSSGQTPGCAQTTICHGNPAYRLDTSSTETLSFVGDAATVKAALLAQAVRAPNMKRVVAGDVGHSFMAYKLSGAGGVACVQGCASDGCGTPMPQVGTLTDAQRTTILDWIALGAAN